MIHDSYLVFQVVGAGFKDLSDKTYLISRWMFHLSHRGADGHATEVGGPSVQQPWKFFFGYVFRLSYKRRICREYFRGRFSRH